MKVYVDRDDVIKLCEQFGVIALKKRIEDLPTTAVTEDVKTVFHSYGKNPKFIENVGTMNISL